MKIKQLTGWVCAVGLAIGSVAGCGGGDGGNNASGNDSPKNEASPGARAAAQAAGLTQLSLSMASGAGGGGSDAMAGRLAKRTFRASVASLKKTRANRTVAAAVLGPVTSNCGISGSMTVDVTTGTTVYDACIESSFGFESYKDGTLQVSTDGATTNVKQGDSSKPFINRLSVSGVLVFESSGKFELTMTGSGTPVMCDFYSLYPADHTVIAGELGFKSDDDSDGNLDEDISLTLNDVVIDGTYADFNLDTCEAMSGTSVETGGFNLVDHLDDTQSVDVMISGSDPVTVQWSDTATTETFTIAGTVTMVTSCFSGTITIETLEPIVADFDEDCPKAGSIKVTGDAVATITNTSTGGVEIDSGSNGTIDATFDSCLDAGSCS